MSNSTQGHIRRRGNNYQAIVYAGRDPVTGRKRYLRESAPTEEKAEEARKRLVDQVEQGRMPDQKATVSLLLASMQILLLSLISRRGRRSGRMTEDERTPREDDHHDAAAGSGEGATARAKDTADEVKAKAQETASHLAETARAKTAQAANQANHLGRKAREAASDPERANTRRTAAPLLAAAGVAAVVVGLIRRRKSKQRSSLRRIPKKK